MGCATFIVGHVRACRRFSSLRSLSQVAMPPPDYQTWSKDQLISRIEQLERRREKRSGNPPKKSKPTSLLSFECNHETKPAILKKSKKERTFDFSKYATRRVAFRIAYFGWNYHGYASQVHTSQTIEHFLFEALMTSKLIQNIEDADYSRCGRTDKGVSATGNVISLIVRSRMPADAPFSQENADEELPYMTMLNRLLPPYIRVVAWAPVPGNFIARFSCTGRTYKYFFPGFGLNISAMSEAVQYFQGTHDFRNFCKIDPSKPQRTYERHIFEASIAAVVDQGLPNSPCNSKQPNSSGFYCITIKGSAFLWHQIRCMTYVLFLVGQRLEAPEIVKDLLNISKYPAKPQFDMASEIPLVLWDCEFPNLKWYYHDSIQDPWHAVTTLTKHVTTMYETFRIQSFQVDLLLQMIMQQTIPLTSNTSVHPCIPIKSDTQDESSLHDIIPSMIELGFSSTIPWGTTGTLFPVMSITRRPKSYLPLELRKSCDSVASRAEKLAEKKRKLLELDS
jgi:tRNA pseudouridine38/39 synthase